MSKKILRTLLAIVASIIFIFSAWKLLDYFYSAYRAQKTADNLIEEVVAEKPAKITKREPKIAEQEEKKTAPITVDFEKLGEENEDIVAWLYSPDTVINYPVVQSEDNSYYLRRKLDGSHDEAGTLFVDYRFCPDFSDLNTIIYGHNRRIGIMFGSLKKYREQEYYEEHPVMYLLTPDVDYEVELFAGFVTESTSDVYRVLEDEEDKKAYIDHALKKTTFKAEVEIAAEDKILSLSTCSSDFKNSRYVVTGVLRELAPNVNADNNK